MPEIKTDVMLAGGGGKKTNAGETIYMALGLLLGEIPNRDGINMVNTSKRSNHELLDFGCFEHLGIVWGVCWHCGGSACQYQVVSPYT